MSDTKAAAHRGLQHSNLEGAQGRQVRFRPERFSGGLVPGVACRVRYRDYDLRDCEGEVIDFSRTGLAFRVDPEEVLRNNEQIRGLQVLVGDELVFSGDGWVVNQRPAPEGTIVGVSLVAQRLDVERIFQLRDVAELSTELRELEAQNARLLDAPIPSGVKALVADGRLYLERWKSQLDALEENLRGADRDDSSLTHKVLEGITPDFARRFQGFAARLHEANQGLPQATQDACRRYAQLHLLPLIVEAPFNRQAYEKPLGYAGDHVTMGYIHGAEYRGRTLFGRLVHRATCLLTAGQAVTQRNVYLKSQLRSVWKAVWEREQRPVRILSLACGSAQEIRDFLREHPDAQVELTLIDQDRQAMECSHDLLSRMQVEHGYAGSVRFANLAIKQLVRSDEFVSTYGGQDLIFAAGLFDYLERYVAKRLTERLFGMLRPGGRLVVGNLTHTCDTRTFLEYLLDWYMIYRSEAELTGLAEALDPRGIRIEQEKTGVNLFLVLEA